MGGEKMTSATSGGTSMGSPPHGRGKASVPAVLIHPPGITPAWAGKSFCYISCNISIGDHPRMGGEKVPCPLIAFPAIGSPPHGRGKAYTKSFEEHGFGITPAWAGKSADNYKEVPTLRDHPRMGGEKLILCLDS